MTPGPAIRARPSPNCDDRPTDTPIDTLILHYTGMRTAQEAIDRLCDLDPPTGRRVSSHYVVDEDGLIWNLVPEEKRAWHAGVSYWRGAEALNGRSIGIEIVNPGHEFGYRPFPVLQLAAVCDLCLAILSRHPIPPRNVVGHSDVAPDRKQDPGELFDWEALAGNGVGLWPDFSAADETTGVDLLEARTLLGLIGYNVRASQPLLAAQDVVVTAFQRHWRPESVTGTIDAATMARLRVMARAVLAAD